MLIDIMFAFKTINIGEQASNARQTRSEPKPLPRIRYPYTNPKRRQRIPKHQVIHIPSPVCNALRQPAKLPTLNAPKLNKSTRETKKQEAKMKSVKGQKLLGRELSPQKSKAESNLAHHSFFRASLSSRKRESKGSDHSKREQTKRQMAKDKRTMCWVQVESRMTICRIRKEKYQSLKISNTDRPDAYELEEKAKQIDRGSCPGMRRA